MTSLSQSALDALRRARSVAVVTGAGISAESGIPTYRGAGGLYDDPVEGDRTMEALSAPTIATDPDRTWRAVARLAKDAVDAKPNAGHEALARIEGAVDQFVLLTQNVDGLHRTAGSKNVIEIHGNIRETVCMRCRDHRSFEVDRYRNLETAPRCAVDGCDGTLRPAVVLFGELLDPEAGARMQRELFYAKPDVVLAVGTSAMFPYIVEPVYRARQDGRPTFEINPEPTDVSELFDHCLRGRASEVLPQIAEALSD